MLRFPLAPATAVSVCVLLSGCVFEQLGTLPPVELDMTAGEDVSGEDISQDVSEDSSQDVSEDAADLDAGACEPSCENGLECVEGECICPAGKNVCNGVCDVIRCGGTCQVCPEVDGGTATCVFDACSIQCDVAGHIFHQGQCIPAGRSCGDSPANPIVSCDPVLQTGCVGESLCVPERLAKVGGCNTNNDCALGEACLEENGAKLCRFYEAVCRSTRAVSELCSQDFQCGGLNCIVDLCGSCLNTSDCPNEKTCVKGETDSMGFCRGPVVTTLTEGQACVEGQEPKCEAGLMCRQGTCRKVCTTLDGLGCDSTESCRPLFFGNGLGTCESSC